MNNKFDHLLGCVGEECGEIQQVAGKIVRFGALDTNPKTQDTNWIELKKEINDLVAVVEMLCAEFDDSICFDRKMISDKKKKVLQYMEYAKSIGQLEET